MCIHGLNKVLLVLKGAEKKTKCSLYGDEWGSACHVLESVQHIDDHYAKKE